MFSERERSLSLTDIACPFVVCLSVCLSVTLVLPTQSVVIFVNISTAYGNLAARKNFTEIVPGEPLRRGS